MEKKYDVVKSSLFKAHIERKKTVLNQTQTNPNPNPINSKILISPPPFNHRPDFKRWDGERGKHGEERERERETCGGMDGRICLFA